MISIILPTIRDAEKTLKSIKCSLPIEVITEADIEHIGCPKMVKKLVDRAKYDWICFIGDDTELDAECLDTAYNYALEHDLWLVGFNDEHRPKATHWLANKKLLDYLENEEFFYTGYTHNFCDDELRIKADKLGKYGWCQEAKIYHNHPAFGGVDDGKYVTSNENWKHDYDLFKARNCRISVSMIVKNEEVMLAKCLESVKGADEIIIVDTGSKDKTKEIASKYTDKIYDFEWCDDFAKARNFAKDKCTMDWLLSIDADEILDEGGIEKLKNEMATPFNTILIKLKSGTSHSFAPRAFRNKESIKWVGRIHENPSVTDGNKTTVGITYGTSPAHELDPDLDLRILQNEYWENQDNTRTMFYLAREYGYRKRWQEAEDLLEKYLKKAQWLPERADAYFMLAVCYWYDGQGNGEKARQNCLMALNINANFKAAIELMAEMSYEHNAVQWKEMAKSANNKGLLFVRTALTI